MNRFILGDALAELKKLDSESVHCCVTSPPYWALRDYGVEGQLGLEATPQEYVAKLVEIFAEVRRVLRPSGTLWLNLGDSYAGSWGAQGRQGKSGALAGRNACAQRQIAAAAKKRSLTGSTKMLGGIKPKDLVGIPWMVAFALREGGWYLRQDIIWHKPNPMPESVRDRSTKAHEYIFLLSKAPKYYFDHEAIKEPASEPRGPGNKRLLRDPGLRTGANANIRGSLHKIGPRKTRSRRSVWTINTKPFKGAHFATFPPKLIEPCIKAGCPPEGIVLDPFLGAGTTAYVAKALNRRFIGIEINEEYLRMARNRVGE